MLMDFAMITLRRIVPPDMTVRSQGNDMVAVVGADGQAVVQLPLGSVLMVLIDTGVLGTNPDDYFEDGWECGDEVCVGAKRLSTMVREYIDGPRP